MLVFLVSIALTAFFSISKHHPTLAGVNPFARDPYDAVGSFGVQLSFFAVLLLALRSFRPNPSAEMALRAAAVSLLAALAILIADAAALVRNLSLWLNSSPGRILAAMAAGLFVLTAFAGGRVLHLARNSAGRERRRSGIVPAAVWVIGLIALALFPASWGRTVPGAILSAAFGMVILFVLVRVAAGRIFPSPYPGYDDVFDDLSAWYLRLSSHPGRAAGVLRRLAGIARRSWIRKAADALNPRRRTWPLVLVIAAGMGSAAALAQFAGEGLPSKTNLIGLVVSVLVGLEGAGVLFGYALLGRFLGIVRPEEKRRGPSTDDPKRS